jgi:choline dehydrogenase-like flavoprotein
VILDALDDGVHLNRRVQLAIVGAGPVGVTLARELGDCVDVLVIESGGLRAEPDYEALNVGDCTALPYPLIETRTRQVGGSTALWAGYCAPFDAHDFTHRPWIPWSGWPFGIDELRLYYAKSARLLNIGDPSFDAGDVARLAGIELPFAGDAVVPSMWRFGTPTLRLNERAGAEPASIDMPTLVHATVVDIRLDAGHSAVTELVVRTMNGREGRIGANEFVVACGGIETARLLLNADTQIPGGIGNARGLVGRYFMEHPHLPIATLDLEKDALRGFLEKQETTEAKNTFLFNIGLPAEVQEDIRVLNARAHVYRTPTMRPDESPRIGLFMEQAPNPHSRLTLSERTDALGMRRISLNWQLTELEWDTYRESGALFRRAFERAGVGRVTNRGSSHDASLILHSNHHLGTTRMADAPADGVVDANGRVHDVGNLHLMGGGVYPTVSWANPTLTLMALTFRLADHLRQKLCARDERPSSQSS